MRILVLAAWLIGSGALLLGVTLWVRRAIVHTPRFRHVLGLGLTLLAALLAAISVTASGTGSVGMVVAALLPVAFLVGWSRLMRPGGGAGPFARDTQSHGGPRLGANNVMFYLAVLGSLAALGALIYELVNRVDVASTLRLDSLHGITVLGLLVVMLLGLATARQVRRFRHRAVGSLAIVAFIGLVVPGRLGLPAAACFLGACVASLVGRRGPARSSS